MPRLLASKPYPALVDVYRRERVQDPMSGAITFEWRYDDPETYRCNFMSLKGHAESFGEVYAASDVVKVEVSPEDARHINLSQRLGNMRMAGDEGQQYYSFVGDRVSDAPINYYFNIDGMNPQVSPNGRVVCVEIYGKLAQAA